jgi:predicted porin
MQKKLIALAVAGLASSAAFAQSNVTVYGIADVAFLRGTADGNKTTNKIDSGGLSGSRIGFRGEEDLGGGLKAVFNLTYGIDMDQNQGVGSVTAAGARQQWVGLKGAFGMIAAGRAETTGYDFACATSGHAGSFMDAHAKVGLANVVSCGGGGRASNAAGWWSPTMGGANLTVQHARLTEAAGTQATGKDGYATLFGGNFTMGPVGLMGVYSKISNANTAASDDRVEYGIGGSFDAKVVKVFANYQSNDDKSVGNKNNKWSLAGSVPVGAGNVVAQFAKGNNKESAASDSPKSWTVGYLHSLSKRTTAYAGYNRVKNETAGTVASLIAPTAGGKSSTFGLGLRHSF